VRSIVSSRPRALVLMLSVALLAALASLTASGASGAASAAGPASKKAWADIVAKAKKEGSVNLYSSHNPVNLADAAAKFKEKYGISVSVNRNIDSVLAQQVTAEHGGAKAVADIWMQSSLPYVLGATENGWMVDAVGPDFFHKRFNRAEFAKPGKAWAVGAAVLAIGWNTQRVPNGIKDYPDLLAASLSGGKIGVPQPSVPSYVDFYKWLEANYGQSYVQKLGAQKPKVYLSSLPTNQALASGELAAAVAVPGTTLDDKAKGAPVDFVIPKKGAWNAPWFGMILKQAPHPSAAQLFANYLVTPEGQRALNHRYGAVLKGIPGTYDVPLRRQNLKELTPQKVSEYQAKWSSWFK
jgi:iron(III) transport system substrate-binding protein